jgi:hypothetical protein
LNVNNIDFTFGGADVVSEDLDAVNTDDGMTFPGAGDGNTSAVSIGGHNCRQNVNPAADFYMYFGVYDSYAFQGNKNNATITFDYYDSGTGSYTLQYDGSPGAYTTGSSVMLTNTNNWKTGSFTIATPTGNQRSMLISASSANRRRVHRCGWYSRQLAALRARPAAKPGQRARAGTDTSSLSWTAGGGTPRCEFRHDQSARASATRPGRRMSPVR